MRLYVHWVVKFNPKWTVRCNIFQTFFSVYTERTSCSNQRFLDSNKFSLILKNRPYIKRKSASGEIYLSYNAYIR